MTGAERELEGAAVRQLDVRDEKAIAELIGGFGRLDHLVNCAGVIRRGEELRPDVFAEVIDINLTGTMRLSTAARPLLARQGGTIVNTASMLSFFGGGLVPGYSASKGGVAQLTKSLAIAWAGDNIRVNAIAPGWIETALTQAIRDDETRHRAIADRTALKRWGRPDELAGAVLFLCSPIVVLHHRNDPAGRRRLSRGVRTLRELKEPAGVIAPGYSRERSALARCSGWR